MAKFLETCDPTARYKYISPEEKAIEYCYRNLVLSIGLKPQDTVVELTPSNLIPNEVKRYVQNPFYDENKKAQKIIDCILVKLAQCETASERRSIYQQFRHSLFDPNETGIKKQLQQALQRFQQEASEDTLEDQIKQWEDRYEALEDQWEDRCEALLKGGDDEAASQDDIEDNIRRLDALILKLNEHRERVREIASRIEPSKKSYTRRISRNEEKLQKQLDEWTSKHKLLQVRQKVQNAGKELAENIKLIKEKEEEWAKRTEKVEENLKDFEKAEAEFHEKLRKRKVLTDQWKDLVDDQHEKLGLLKSFWSEPSIQKEYDDIRHQMNYAEERLKFSKDLRDQLSDLQNHGDGLVNVQTFMSQQVDTLTEQREVFRNALKELESIRSTKKEYRETMKVCEEKIKECEERVHHCHENISQVRKEYKCCLEDTKKTLERLKECYKKLNLSTGELEGCEKRVDKCLKDLKNQSVSLSESIRMLTVILESAKGVGKGAIIGGLIGFLIAGPFGAALVGTAGGTIGGAVGHSNGKEKSEAIEEKIKKERRKLYECENNLEICSASMKKLKRIMDNCKDELKEMEACLNDMEAVRKNICM